MLRRSRWTMPIIFGTLALIFAGFVGASVLEEYDDRAVLATGGRQVTTTVVEVIERSRTDEALVVRVALPEGPTFEVDLAESEQSGSEVGQSLRVIVDPNDLHRNMPADYFANGRPLWVALLVTAGPVALVGVGIAALVFYKDRDTTAEP